LPNANAEEKDIVWLHSFLTPGIGSKLICENDILYSTKNGRSHGICYGVVQNSVMRD
jgi:hypothetical protein